MPATAARGQLALPAADMAVYDLTHVPCAEQLRWRTQRCSAHAAAPAAADLALADWEVFDPLLHHQHIHAAAGCASCGLRAARLVSRSRKV